MFNLGPKEDEGIAMEPAAEAKPERNPEPKATEIMLQQAVVLEEQLAHINARLLEMQIKLFDIHPINKDDEELPRRKKHKGAIDCVIQKQGDCTRMIDEINRTLDNLSKI